MRKGMPYPWLMRLSLSAAIALPSATSVWLAIPAAASDSLPVTTSETASLAADEADAAARPVATPPVLAPEGVGSTARFSSTHGVAKAASNHQHQAINPLQPPRPSTDVTSLVASTPSATVAFSHSKPLQESAVTIPASTPQLIETVLPQVEASQFGVLFSQADVESPEVDLPEDDEVIEAEPLDEIDEEVDPDAILDSEEPALDVIEGEDDAIEAEPLEELEEGTDPETLLDEEETILDETDLEEDDEVFSPLPESDTDPELEIEDSDVDVDTNLEDLSRPEPEPPPGVAPGEAVSIPEERILDALEYLNPSPNPLLIQTAPEEVEIIGTQPLTLEEAIELAYRNNPDLRVALLEVEQSRASLREAQAELYPTISVNGNLEGRNTTQTSTGVVTTPGGGLSFETETNEELGVALSAQVDVVYNIYSSGLRGANIRAAEEQVQLAELELERRREELRLATASEYYDLQAAIEAIRISQAFLEEAERNLRDTTLREEVGVGTRFDVLRAEVQVANARQDLVNSQRARQVAQRALARRLNVPPSLTITTAPVDIAGVWPLDLEESIVLAFQNRAELEQQLTQREINEELVTAALATVGPQVDLFANYNISDILTQSDSFNDNYSFGARVSWTLFEGGAAQARARQRELDIEIAERNFEEARNTIRLGVESAYFNLQSNLANIDTARLAVEQAQEALDLAILRFDAGVGTQLDILNAQSELTDAEVNLVQAIVGYNRSLAELKRAVSNIPEPYYEEIPY